MSGAEMENMNSWISMNAVMLVVASVAQAAEPVAMITDVRGNAWLQNNGKEVKLNVLSYLEPGMSLRLDNKSSVTIATFNPATVLSASGPVRLELHGAEVHLASGARLQGMNLDEDKASAAHKFSVIQRERMTIAGYQMKSLELGLALQSPENTTLLTDRPDFKWSAPQIAINYVLTLSDETDGKQVSEATVSVPEWKLPVNQSLQRDHRYLWQVTTKLASGQSLSSVGRFSILSEARAEKIEQPADNASFSDKMLYAVLLESEGLKTDAAVAWKSLAAERPEEVILNALSE
jgi:hypothetical protein